MAKKTRKKASKKASKKVVKKAAKKTVKSARAKKTRAKKTTAKKTRPKARRKTKAKSSGLGQRLSDAYHVVVDTVTGTGALRNKLEKSGTTETE